GQMNPAEVIAIEVKQYLSSDGMRTLVPRVIGQTAEVEPAKAGEQPRVDAGGMSSRSSRRSSRSVATARHVLAGSCTTGQRRGDGVRPLAPAASTARGFPSSKRAV